MELPDLPRCLAELLKQIPHGQVTTYGALAEALGSDAAARWVGHWMVHHDHAAGCPCHRVVRVDGSLGRYISGDDSDKAALLSSEGVVFDAGRVRGIGEESFRTFRTARPLATLRALQDKLGERISLRGRRTMPERVAGVDVSYSGDRGTGAYVLWDLAREEMVWSTTVSREVTFPYIPGFLAFRELPVLRSLLEAAHAARQQGDVVIVDGSGILHPRGVGIACHLGLLMSTATIGVSKKLLCGQVDLKGMAAEEARPVLLEGRRRGVALRATGGSQRPIFVSPGHRVGVDMAELIVRRQLCGRRLPEVQYWADRLSRSVGQGGSGGRFESSE